MTKSFLSYYCISNGLFPIKKILYFLHLPNSLLKLFGITVNIVIHSNLNTFYKMSPEACIRWVFVQTTDSKDFKVHVISCYKRVMEPVILCEPNVKLNNLQQTQQWQLRSQEQRLYLLITSFSYSIRNLNWYTEIKDRSYFHFVKAKFSYPVPDDAFEIYIYWHEIKRLGNTTLNRRWDFKFTEDTKRTTTISAAIMT